jgi:signal transduction histidine kinase
MKGHGHSFLAKLTVVLGVAAAALVASLASSAFFAQRVASKLLTIERRDVPRLELEPQLEGEFERLQRVFLDAVAGRDPDALSTARDLRHRFFARLDAAGEAVEPHEAAALRSAFDDYFSAANDVAHRLLASETGEGVVDAAAEMQRRQADVEQRIHVVAALDRHELAGAFGSAARSAQLAGEYGLAIGVACLIGAIGLSVRLGREVVRAVGEVTAGFQLFGTGDFSRKITVRTGDELQLIAEKANEMAESLERIGAARAQAEHALAVANRELETFSYTVAHDLRAPLRAINGFSRALQEDLGNTLDEDSKDNLHRIAAAAQRMGELIDSLLSLAKVSRTELRRERIDMTQLAGVVVRQLRMLQADRQVTFLNDEGVVAYADRPLVQGVLENLLGNAWKFTVGRLDAEIRFGSETTKGERTYFVRDNGAGFDMAYAAKLFAPFQRMHKASEFAGTGIGLATVQRIVARHGGRVWATATVGQGATFYFTLPTPNEGTST